MSVSTGKVRTFMSSSVLHLINPSFSELSVTVNQQQRSLKLEVCARARVCACRHHIPEEFRSLRQITAGSHNSHSLEMLLSVEVPTLTYRHFCRRGGSSPSQIGQYGSFRVNYAVSAFVTIDGIAASGFPDHVSRVTRCRCCAISICQPAETHLGHNTSK